MAEILLMTYEILQDHNSWVTGDDILVYVNTADNSKRVSKNGVDITSGDTMNNYDSAQVSYTRNVDNYYLDNGDYYSYYSLGGVNGKSGLFPYVSYYLVNTGDAPPPTGLQKLHKFEFREATGTWLTTDKVETFWDTDTNTIVVKKNGSNITSSDDITFFEYTSDCNNDSGIGCKTKLITTNYNYSFCDGNDLSEFSTNLAGTVLVFPYSKRKVTVNSPVCTTSTCDITFDGQAIVTNATGSANNDGSLEVTASSSGASIEYGLDDFYYGTGQINGTFTGLYPGTYTVYAKDANGCSVFQYVTVGYEEVSTTYGVKYRLTYDQINDYYSSKIDILELGYDGAIEEVTGADNPFTVSWNGDGSLDKFKPITPGEAQIGFVNTTAQGDFYFKEIFTSDERTYKVKKYIDEGAGETLEWEGFIIPFLYSEPYLSTPYDVFFTATDGLADLDKFDFEDQDGNKLSGDLKAIKVLSICLQKTDLDFNIRVGCNLYETNHNQTASDDPLDQTYVDALAYKGMSCKEVVEAILKPFRARLFAVNGIFHIVRSEEQTTSYDYREFDINGDYVSNGTYNPVKDIKAASFTDRSVFVNRSPVLEILPAYRTLTINQLLGPKETLLENGDFEDYLRSSTGVLINPFPNWFLKLNGNTGVYLYETKGRSGERAIKFFGGSFSTPDQFPYIESKPYPIDWTEGDKIKFSVYYFVDAYPGLKGDSSPKYGKFKYSVKLGSYYLKAGGGWTLDPDQEFITKFIQSPNSGWQSLEVVADVPEGDGSGNLIVKLQSDYFQQSAYDDIPDLKTVSTYNKPEGFIAWTEYVVDGNPYDTTYIYYYKLVSSVAAESLPDIVRPDDFYSSSTGLQYSLTSGNNEGNTTVTVKQTISGPQPGSINILGDLYYYSTFSGTTFTLTTPLTKSYSEDDPLSRRDNRIIWQKLDDEELKSTDGLGGYLGQCNIEKFDDVVFQYLPLGEEPIESKKISLTNNLRIKNDYEEDYFHGDVHNTSSGRYIYRNYFRLSDGTPTAQWARDGVSEATEILKIALKTMSSQYSLPTYKISGEMLSDTRVTILNTLRETFDSNRKYLLSGLTINDKQGTYNFEMYELSGTADGEDGGGDGSTFNGDFNADFGAQFDTILS